MSADPYAEGADAWLAGEPETANPYDPESDEYLSWSDGWSDAENDAFGEDAE